MKNPAAINQPKLPSAKDVMVGQKKQRQGNLPYLRYRRRLRRNILSRF